MIRQSIRYLRTKLGRETYRQKAEGGDYRYQYCPHCGLWVPHRYLGTNWMGRMKVDCPRCETVSVVTEIDEDDMVEPIVSPRDTLPRRLQEQEEESRLK